MKIAITGPHCCGKSTVMKRISQCFTENPSPNISFHGFSGASAPVDYSSAKDLKVNQENELQLTYWMVSKLILRECELSCTEGIHIFDRCLIDQIVYPEVIMGKKYPAALKSFIEDYLARFKYQHIFLLPVNYDLLCKYGKKDKSPEFAAEVYLEYLKVCSGFEYCTVLPQNQELQVRIISDYIRDQLNNYDDK